MRSWIVLVGVFAVAGIAAAAQPTKRPSDHERGKELYERHCASCHGAAARGDGLATRALVAPVPDLQGKVSADKPTIEVVVTGRGPMPGFEASFDAADAKRVLAYMGKLTDEPAPAQPAEEPEPEPELEPEEAEGPAEGPGDPG